MEEIVGEIEDETDEHGPEQIRKIDANCYTVDAITEIADFNEYFDVGLPDDEFDTVAGLIINALGRLPAVTDKVVINDFHFTVVAGDSRKITQLEVTRIAS